MTAPGEPMTRREPACAGWLTGKGARRAPRPARREGNGLAAEIPLSEEHQLDQPER
jgi:hypothetical protein